MRPWWLNGGIQVLSWLLTHHELCLLLVLLSYSVGKLHALHDQLFASVSKLFILVLQSLANFEQVETFLLPDGCDRSVITL